MTSCVLLGTAIGDSMGKPFETMDRNDQALRNWQGGTYLPGTHEDLGEAGRLPGAWTDDTQMSLSLAQSIIDNKGIYDPDKAADAYVQWYLGKGPGGPPRGIGGTLRKAMKRLALGKSWEVSGETYKVGDPVGCGTAMRAAILGVAGTDDAEVLRWAEQDATITHNHPEAQAGSAAVALLVHYAQMEMPWTTPVRLVEKILNILRGVGYSNTLVVKGMQIAIRYTPETWWRDLNDIGASGLVWEVVPTAVLCFLLAGTNRDGTSLSPILEAYTYAVKAGGDTDSRAAITGAFLGARYGIDSLKSEMIHIEDARSILAMDETVISLRNARK